MLLIKRANLIQVIPLTLNTLEPWIRDTGCLSLEVEYSAIFEHAGVLWRV